MKTLLFVTLVLVISIAGYFNFASHRCGWMDGRVLPCIERPVGADRFCAAHDKLQREKITRLLGELRAR